MSEPKLIHARFKPTARPWTDLHRDMLLSEMFLLGLTSGEINERMRVGIFEFSPAIGSEYVRQAFTAWLKEDPERAAKAKADRDKLKVKRQKACHRLTGPDKDAPKKVERKCMTCNQKFLSWGTGNRLCLGCTRRCEIIHDGRV